jgi:hypothetical protein
MALRRVASRLASIVDELGVNHDGFVSVSFSFVIERLSAKLSERYAPILRGRKILDQ